MNARHSRGARIARALALAALPALVLATAPARAAETLNAYSIWPENWARPMFEEFEKERDPPAPSCGERLAASCRRTGRVMTLEATDGRP